MSVKWSRQAYVLPSSARPLMSTRPRSVCRYSARKLQLRENAQSSPAHSRGACCQSCLWTRCKAKRTREEEIGLATTIPRFQRHNKRKELPRHLQPQRRRRDRAPHFCRWSHTEDVETCRRAQGHRGCTRDFALPCRVIRVGPVPMRRCAVPIRDRAQSLNRDQHSSAWRHLDWVNISTYGSAPLTM